ncbi:MAG: ABC transporter permease [Lachnospiraceae bacterium]|nr:ABC transporter permease [Lachnospiraceae bacterium]
MKALSAWYYIKENKGRALIIIFLLFLTTCMFLAGNYVDSTYYYWERSCEYFDKMYVVSALSTDEDFKEFAQIYEDLKADEELIVLPRSPWGLRGLSWTCTMGFEMGAVSMVFDTPEDMKTAFERFGIQCDMSEVKDQTVVLSTALARQYGLKKGDILDATVAEGISGSYRVAALIEDDSYILYYVLKSEGDPLRLNILGRDLTGNELREHIASVVAGRKADIGSTMREEINKQFVPFDLIFGIVTLMLALIISVIVNTVITGQFIARTYEFGVYRAIGMSRGRIFRKVAAEILMMDLIAIVCGGILILTFSFLMNELIYIPAGQYLPYYTHTGFFGFLLSDILVVLPTILLKGHAMSKGDVTRF